MESVTLHEMGHALGLGHTNLASDSDLGHPQSDVTAAYKGSDGVFNVNPGSDSVYGSDDIRGDDLNFNYFNPSNNPFILATPADKSIYKNGISYLPSGHKFATTANIANIRKLPHHYSPIFLQLLRLEVFEKIADLQ